jgi:hypothetical protein
MQKLKRAAGLLRGYWVLFHWQWWPQTDNARSYLHTCSVRGVELINPSEDYRYYCFNITNCTFCQMYWCVWYESHNSRRLFLYTSIHLLVFIMWTGISYGRNWSCVYYLGEPQASQGHVYLAPTHIDRAHLRG